MLFDTHSSVEHLAMMEVVKLSLNRFLQNHKQIWPQRVLGPLPVKMVERSKLKYFSKVRSAIIKDSNKDVASSRTKCFDWPINNNVFSMACIILICLFQGKLKWDEDSSAGRHVRRKVDCFWIWTFPPLLPETLRHLDHLTGETPRPLHPSRGARQRRLGGDVRPHRPDAQIWPD